MATGSEILSAAVGIVALNCVAGSYALEVRDRERMSDISARAFADVFFFTMMFVGGGVLGVVNLCLEEPPETLWWVYGGPLAAVPLAILWGWWRLGRWPVRRLALPMLLGLPSAPPRRADPPDG